MKGKREERRPTAQGSLNDLGSRILNQSRYELSLSMRHLARALDRLPYEMDFNTQRMGTEGERIHFHPEFIFQLFMESPQKLNRLYMHSLLHCLFRHMFKNEDKKEELWNMACDIHVEYVLDSLDVDLLKRPAGEYRENTFQRLEEKIKTLSAERIYQYLEEADLDYDAWERLEREFYKDDHVFWKVIDRKDAPGQEGEGDSDGAPLPLPEDFTPNDNGTPSNGEGKEEKNQEAGNQEPENRGSEGEGNTGEGNSGEDSQGETKQEDSQSGNSSGKKQEERKKAENRKPPGQEKREEREAKKKRDDLSKEWEDISKRTEQEIEHSSKEKQEEQGSLAWFLRLEQKKYTDFRDFLRRLSVRRQKAAGAGDCH